MKDDDDLKMTIGRALGRVPSGLFVLTVGTGTSAMAMLVSWVQQAGFEPPMITIAIAKGRPIHQRLKDAGKFGLSVIADDDGVLMKAYARGAREGDSAFAGLSTIATDRGVTVMADALAWMECELAGICDPAGGDHELFIARVTGGKILRDARSFIHLRGNGLRY